MISERLKVVPQHTTYKADNVVILDLGSDVSLLPLAFGEHVDEPTLTRLPRWTIGSAWRKESVIDCDRS